MNLLSVKLRKQQREIERLKNCKIYAYKGYGKSDILVFDKIIHFPNEEPRQKKTQKCIDEGYYKSIEAFDARHTADIEFEGEYSGAEIEKYRCQTKLNLIELGKAWRARINEEFPNAELTIVVHKHNNEWFLDTFNSEVVIENGIYL